MNSLVLFTIVAATVTLSAAQNRPQNTQPACDALIRCMSDAVNQKRRCDNITATIRAKWPPKYTDYQLYINERADRVTAFDYTRRDQKITCLKNSIENSTIVYCDEARQKMCSDRLDAFKPRSKRQAATPTPASPATTKPTTRTTTLSPAQIKAAEEKALSAAKAAADKKERDDLNAALTKCNMDAWDLDHVCSGLAECCSESWLCDLKFIKGYQDYQGIVTLQHDLQLERRGVSCPAPPPAPTSPPPPTTKAATVPAGRK